MNVTTRRYASAVVLQLNGRLDQDTCEGFCAELGREVDAAGAHGACIVLDLSGLDYISSAGLRCFMLASRRAKAQQGRILVTSLQPMVSEIFRISHFDLVLPLFPSLREALGAVSAEAGAAYDRG